MHIKSYMARMVALLFAVLLLAACSNQASVTPPTPPTNLSWDQTNWDQVNWQ